MPGYLISDGSTIHLTDGLTKRPVPFNGDRFNELLFLGQAKNARHPDGGPDIPTMPDYLASIPNAGLSPAIGPRSSTTSTRPRRDQP